MSGDRSWRNGAVVTDPNHHPHPLTPPPSPPQNPQTSPRWWWTWDVFKDFPQVALHPARRLVCPPLARQPPSSPEDPRAAIQWRIWRLHRNFVLTDRFFQSWEAALAGVHFGSLHGRGQGSVGVGRSSRAGWNWWWTPILHRREIYHVLAFSVLAWFCLHSQLSWPLMLAKDFLWIMVWANLPVLWVAWVLCAFLQGQYRRD